MNANKYELICQYCGKNWEINYDPKSKLYCVDCRDSNIRVKVIATDRVDYYIGCPPFRDKEEEQEEDVEKYYY